MDKMLLKIREAADVTGLGLTKFRELIANGDVEVVYIGGAARVIAASLQDYVERLRSAPPAGQERGEAA